METMGRAAMGRKLPHLRRWREYRGMSAKEVGAAAAAPDGTPVHKVTLSNLEHGRDNASWELIDRLARALRISRHRLIHEEPPTT